MSVTPGSAPHNLTTFISSLSLEIAGLVKKKSAGRPSVQRILRIMTFLLLSISLTLQQYKMSFFLYGPKL
ncbi:uncharacterized protein EV154DRAFT_527294 [Mucor mucedo]|uniref:uncharacterized protein n=1 Tax=Mucor mucedo TaxID=29922 RepID=UPI002220F8CF|nr:uncharacterized protein EV154DRAFT_527294 [Mucor mucedo]KAI7874362.1 hypothetical protein EV154DRAFT_527294 [Mucor mucedo]